MNPALTYLWLALLKRRFLHFARSLRRPGTLIGFVAIASLLGFFFYHRHSEYIGRFLQQRNMAGLMLVMLGGSLFKGFTQRGLVFDPPDIEFLFTSPFTQQQIVFYRLLPNYLYSVIQGFVFLALLQSHLQHPLVTFVCVILFQIACFHISTGASIFAGTLPELLHERIRWMMVGTYFLIAAVYLRLAWDVSIIPAFLGTSLAQILFYPAVTLSDVAGGPSLYEWIRPMLSGDFSLVKDLGQQTLVIAAFGIGAATTLWLLLQFNVNVLETAVEASAQQADSRLRIRQGRQIVVQQRGLRSVRLPSVSLFRGVGAVVWKNLVVAWRSKRDLAFALTFTLIYTALIFALLRRVPQDLLEGKGPPLAGFFKDVSESALSGITILAFFLQRKFSFDFRRDGFHVVDFRTLPVSPIGLALAEIAVPSVFTIALQMIAVAILMYYARPDPLWLAGLLLAFPAIALAINGVWNLYYMVFATRRAGGKTESASAAGTLLVVSLSFMVFFPAIWTHFFIVRRVDGPWGRYISGGAALAVLYGIDIVLVLVLARLFERFEVSRDFQ